MKRINNENCKMNCNGNKLFFWIFYQLAEQKNPKMIYKKYRKIWKKYKKY